MFMSCIQTEFDAKKRICHSRHGLSIGFNEVDVAVDEDVDVQGNMVNPMHA
jgi:hypothetical protein